MRCYQQLTMASALIFYTSAFPMDKREANSTGASTFTLVQSEPKVPGTKLAGPIALSRAIGKYAKVGAEVPAVVNAAAAKVYTPFTSHFVSLYVLTEVNQAAATDDGTVAANPSQYDSEYIETVSIGGQRLNLDFDTGSSDL